MRRVCVGRSLQRLNHVVAATRVEVREQGVLQWRGWFTNSPQGFHGGTTDDGSLHSAGLVRVREAQVIRHDERARGGPIGPLDWLRRKSAQATASSDRLGWVGLEAARCRATPAFELNLPTLRRRTSCC